MRLSVFSASSVNYLLLITGYNILCVITVLAQQLLSSSLDLVVFLFCFITSVSCLFYMIYKRYQLSNMEATQHNITYPQVVPASQHQGQNKSSKISTS